MRLTEIPLSVLFVVFLLVFSLVGLYPAWKGVATKMRRFISSRDKSERLVAGRLKGVAMSRFDGRKPTSPLNSYEVLVFRRLVQGDDRGLSRKQLRADLHLGDANVKQSLQSLQTRGLISIAPPHLLSIRFSLSEKGHAYAVEQDLMPHILQGMGRR